MNFAKGFDMMVKSEVMGMDLAKRKQNRLEEYDYSTPGAYFITVCTANREKIFWNGVGADNIRPYGVNGSWFYETVGFPENRQTYLAKVIL